jgi:hypothetical protein
MSLSLQHYKIFFGGPYDEVFLFNSHLPNLNYDILFKLMDAFNVVVFESENEP